MDEKRTFIGFINEQAIVTDNPDDASIEIVYDGISWPYARSIFTNEKITYAHWMAEYTGDNEETYNNFVNYVIDNINNGTYLHYCHY
jgi:hypothetical protein